MCAHTDPDPKKKITPNLRKYRDEKHARSHHLIRVDNVPVGTTIDKTRKIRSLLARSIGETRGCLRLRCTPAEQWIPTIFVTCTPIDDHSNPKSAKIFNSKKMCGVCCHSSTSSSALVSLLAPRRLSFSHTFAYSPHSPRNRRAHSRNKILLMTKIDFYFFGMPPLFPEEKKLRCTLGKSVSKMGKIYNFIVTRLW